MQYRLHNARILDIANDAFVRMSYKYHLQLAPLEEGTSTLIREAGKLYDSFRFDSWICNCAEITFRKSAAASGLMNWAW